MAGFQQVRVGKEIEFVGDAATRQNMTGYWNPNKIMREWNFKELTLDETNQYTVYIDTTSAVALGNSGLTLTTAATDTKTCSYAFGGIKVLAANNPVVEFCFQLDVITTVAINAVLTDAVTEASGVLPFLISGTTVADTATNGVGFCRDTEQTTDRWYMVNTKAGAQAGTIVAAGLDPFAAATNIRLRIELLSTEVAKFYVNGVHVGSKSASTTAATPLVPYVGIRNNSAAAHVMTLRYVRLWEDA
ncbi:MAG: hypothetical protein UW18_C0014G0005 [Microgenomates group bacterium GW2011_GWF1_44_10]|nr:MAG: hypothetical protein UW18_C0014G0005 [Microgenomates group bacterium GW2011_GWF1_44_10]